MKSQNIIFYFVCCFLFIQFSCDVFKKHDRNASIENNMYLNKEDSSFYKRVQYIEKSVGVLSLKYHNTYDYDNIEILNKDKTVYVSLSYKENYIKIHGKLFKLFGASFNKYIDSNLTAFSPKNFNPELQIIQFECTKTSGNYWEVFINKGKTLKKLIRKDTNTFLFEDWKTHFYSIMTVYDKYNPLRIHPNETSDIVNIEDKENIIFCISEIDGDWVKLQCIDACGIVCDKSISGWVKWTDGKKILIEMYYSC